MWVVPNIEHHEHTAPDGSVDVPQFSHTDYGNRVGIWRLMRVLDRFGIPGTVGLNSAACRHYPTIIEACLQRDWELMGHGLMTHAYGSGRGRRQRNRLEQAARTYQVIELIQ